MTARASRIQPTSSRFTTSRKRQRKDDPEIGAAAGPLVVLAVISGVGVGVDVIVIVTAPHLSLAHGMLHGMVLSPVDACL